LLHGGGGTSGDQIPTTVYKGIDPSRRKGIDPSRRKGIDPSRKLYEEFVFESENT
jgi:hypothetical protein